jgi:ferritin-like protein
MRLLLPLLVALCASGAAPALADGFRFSQPDTSAAREADGHEARIAKELAVPCRSELLNRKIMVVIGETMSNGAIDAHQENFGPHYRAINRRLQALGLRTYTPEQIRKQVAQAEIDAYFRNDPDAALAASRKLGASFVLRGLITSNASVNPMMAVNQVSVNMGFTLTASNGRAISNTQASASSYAGADVRRMAQTLVDEQADEVVAKLYGDYCRNAARS